METKKSWKVQDKEFRIDVDDKGFTFWVKDGEDCWRWLIDGSLFAYDGTLLIADKKRYSGASYMKKIEDICIVPGQWTKYFIMMGD